MQVLLVLVAAGLLVFAGFGWGKRTGYDEGRRAGDLGGPARTSLGEVVVPAALALAFLGGAFLLQGRGGLRMPSPARLEELARRAEQAAVDRAERAASTD